jgi:hypothetical protein
MVVAYSPPRVRLGVFRPRRRLTLLAVATAVPVIAVAAAIARPHSAPAVAPAATVATVDGTAVPVEQIRVYLEQERAATFAFFLQRYGLADGPHFWTTRRGGETPTTHVQALALADAVRLSLQLTIAHQVGLVSNPSFDAVLASWHADTKRRQSAVAQGLPVYGPTQMNEPAYIAYLLGNLDVVVQSKLAAQGTIPVRPADLREFYRQHAANFPALTQAEAGTSDAVKTAYEKSAYQAYLAQRVHSAHVVVNRRLLAEVRP